MSVPLNITKQIDIRRRLASNDAEIIARSRDMVARSKDLLNEDAPRTFLGERHYPEPREK
jgi:hypothetical protein